MYVPIWLVIVILIAVTVTINHYYKLYKSGKLLLFITTEDGER